MENWAIFGATLLGPIFAVLVTLWYQDYSAARNTRLALFATMMRLRSHPTNPEFVGALNVVPVFFSKHRFVVSEYRELLKVYADLGWESKNDEILLRMNTLVRDHIAKLLSEMGKAVKHPFDHLDIMKGVYHPKGWVDDQIVLNEIRNGVRALFRGEYALPVLVIPPGVEGTDQPDTATALPAPKDAPPAPRPKKTA